MKLSSDKTDNAWTILLQHSVRRLKIFFLFDGLEGSASRRRTLMIDLHVAKEACKKFEGNYVVWIKPKFEIYDTLTKIEHSS